MKTASEILCRNNSKLGLPGVACIADDIFIYGCGDTVEQAELNMIAFLERCRECNLRLNDDKLQLKRESVTYMGLELTSSGLRPSRLKIESILDMEQPGDRPALMRLLGMAQYVAKFVPHLSEITTPLRGLLAKDSEFRWTDTHSKALHDLKQLLVSTPTLGYYDVTKPIKIQTDASSSGLGCVCMQDGKPI